MTQTQLFKNEQSENDQLKSVLAEILESTWVVKSPGYYKVLVEAKVIDRAKELVDGQT